MATATATKATKATATKRTRTSKKKDILVPVPVPDSPAMSAPVPTLSALQLFRQEKERMKDIEDTARAELALETMRIANLFATATATATGCVDQFIKLYAINIEKPVKEEFTRLYSIVPHWPTKNGKAVTVAAILQKKGGKWSISGDLYRYDSDIESISVPVALVRLLNAVAKRFYKATAEKTEKTIFEFSSDDFTRLLSALATGDCSQASAICLTSAIEKTVKRAVK